METRRGQGRCMVSSAGETRRRPDPMTSLVVPAALRGRVASIDVADSHDQEVTVLPSTGAVLGVQLRGRVRAEGGLLSTAGITGIQSSARRYAYLGDTTTVLVRFTPAGVACLGVPASELASRSVALDDILHPARVRRLCERLQEAPGVAASVAILQDLLLELPFEEDPLVARGLAIIESSAASGGGMEPVAMVRDMARALAIGERQLERRFLQRVGLTPKRFASLRRFERAVALAGASPSLTQAAFDAGYYDQSHFIRDFRRYAGGAPGEVLRRPR